MNPLTDLLQSFNFFNIQDRYTSNFKLRSLSVKLVHHLRDWDVSFEYAGVAPAAHHQREAGHRVDPDVLPADQVAGGAAHAEHRAGGLHGQSPFSIDEGKHFDYDTVSEFNG